MLVTSVPRRRNESFHELIVIHAQRGNETEVRKIGNQSLYKPDDMVGKAVIQVGVIKSSGELTGDDSETFERVSQAINSAEELVVEALLNASPPLIRVVVPVIVVPNGTLFQADYDSAGNLTKQPHPVKEATLFLDHAWSTDKGMEGKLFYVMSHLHIVTFDSLALVTEHWAGADGFFGTFHPV